MTYTSNPDATVFEPTQSPTPKKNKKKTLISKDNRNVTHTSKQK